MSTELCGHTVIDEDGYEQPCDLPAGEWRWYQDVEHEDMLAPACVIHANEGGRRMHAAEAAIARVEALATAAEATAVGPPFVFTSDIRAALAEPCSCGSRDATSLTPGERLHHSPDGCTIERDEEGGR